MATYTVTNTFTSGTTAVASEVNQNFTDVLTALNAFDASNCSSGTLPLARISGLTVSQLAAATLVTEAEGIDSNDSDTKIATCAAVKDDVDSAVSAAIAAYVTLSAHTNKDSEDNILVKNHAYKAATNGVVQIRAEGATAATLNGYVGGTSDPAGAGTQYVHGVIQSANDALNGTMVVAKDQYFEVTGTCTMYIYWRSFGTLSKPVDQD